MTQNEQPCEWCNGRGYRDVTYGEYNFDGEVGCSECCPHTQLTLISGPGIACARCGTWFKDRAAIEPIES